MPERVLWLNENWHLIVIPVAILVGFTIGGRWLRRIAYDKFNRWTSKTERLGVALFVSKLHGPFLFWFILLGLYAAVKASVLPFEAQIVIPTLLLSVFVCSWIWVTFSISGDIARLYLPKVRQYLARVRGPQPPTGVVVNGLRTIFILIGLAILLSIWQLPNIGGLLVLATGLIIGILALREATTGLSRRLHVSYRTKERLQSIGKVLFSLLVVAGIADIIRRIYLLSTAGLDATLNLVILFLELSFIIWFANILRRPNFRQAKPSFKLVAALLIITVSILAFSGVQPLATYKDNSLAFFGTRISRVSESVRARSSQGDITEIVERIRPAVIRLETSNVQGTGMIIDRTGYILTCAHVVENTQLVDVITYKGKLYNAAVIAQDSRKDLAILQINATRVDFPTVTLGSSESLEIGQEIIAIGYPWYGYLKGDITVSTGIISAFRSLEGVNHVQTDAAINPGNSGGPILDLNGYVVGIATSKIMHPDVEGLGFAVLIDYAKDLIIETNQLYEE